MTIRLSNVGLAASIPGGTAYTFPMTVLGGNYVRRLMHFHPHDWMPNDGDTIKTKVAGMLAFAQSYFTDLVCDVVSWPGIIYASSRWNGWGSWARPDGMHLYDYIKQEAPKAGLNFHIRFPIDEVSTYDELIDPSELLDEWKMSYLTDPDCWQTGWTDMINLSVEACRDWVLDVWLDDFLDNNGGNLPHGIHWNFEPDFDYTDCPDLDCDQFTDIITRARAQLLAEAPGVEHWGATMTRTQANDLAHFRCPLDWLPYIDFIKQGNYDYDADERYAWAQQIGLSIVKPGIGTDDPLYTPAYIAAQLEKWRGYGFQEVFAFVYGESGGSPRFDEDQRDAFGQLTREGGKVYCAGMMFAAS